MFDCFLYTTLCFHEKNLQENYEKFAKCSMAVFRNFLSHHRLYFAKSSTTYETEY